LLFICIPQSRRTLPFTPPLFNIILLSLIVYKSIEDISVTIPVQKIQKKKGPIKQQWNERRLVGIYIKKMKKEEKVIEVLTFFFIVLFP